ncbi:MAG: YjjG family noncanonical pyrimidine nucleotidase [Cyclobacteriaceae bacterium]|nr:YjjG family noncanonical pyrimidine nucleotidase [Cyclobacteriaceae bacterium]
MHKYKYIFFDLDHTLWDYEKNSKTTLKLVYDHFQLFNLKIDFQRFYKTFKKVNNKLWIQYNRREISQQDIRTKRFVEIFSQFNLENKELCLQISNFYMEKGPQEIGLISGTISILNYLADKYKMLILTNGFEHTQHTKLRCTNIKDYFHHVVTSENSGFVKPDTAIFDFALNLCQIEPQHAIMIGDNLQTDILGAKNSGIDSVYFNPDYRQDTIGANYNISSLHQLSDIL